MATNKFLTSITVDGDLGVGTASPTYKLHVAGNSYIDATGNSATLTLGRYSGQPTIKAGTDDSGYLIMDSSGGQVGINWYSGNNVSIANGGGNVAIGHTSPTRRLHVVGEASNDIIAEFKATGTGTSDYAEIHINNNNNDTLVLGSIGSNYSGSAWAGARYLYAQEGDLMIKTIQANTNLRFYTAGSTSERMRITSGGNVGIGTTNPTSILHLENAGNTWAKFINASGTNQRLDVGTNSSSQHFVFGYGDYPVLFGSNGSERMRITSGGNVGIGSTNPSYKLTVAGDIYSSSRVVGDDGIGSRGVFRSWSVYSYSSGILIETDIDVSTADAWDNRMIMLTAYGMTYSGEPPITASFQCYNYNNGQSIISRKGISTDESLTMDVFHYDGKVYFHMEQTSNYQTWHFELQTMGYQHKINSISNSAKPDTGVTNSHTITPSKWWHSDNDGASSGLDADLLDGQQGTYYLNYNNLTNTPTLGTAASSASTDFVAVTGDTMTGTLKLDSELQFYRGSGSDYSNYIRATNYPSQGYTSTTAKYWLEYGAKGGHHFILNTDGGEGASENAYDDFTIWQGAVDGDRLFEVTNVGNVNITGTISASGYNDSNWNTAYNWGNHASAGYSTATGVENNADVTDATNVAAAGALMKSGGTMTGDLTVPNLRSDEETSGTITNNNWYRVLELNGGSGRGKCEFILESNGGSGTPFSLRGAISTTWSAGDQTLTIHHKSLGSISEMRVVRNSAGTKNYLDIKSSGEDNVTFTILPHRKINAEAIDFTNVTTLPDEDTVQDSVTISNKTIISQVGNYSAFTVDQDSSIATKNVNASGDATITGLVKASSYRLSSGNTAISENSNFLYIDASGSFGSGIYINNKVKIDGGLLGSYNEDLQLRTGDTTRMTLSNSTGNVGIGTTSPSSMLEIRKATATHQLVSLNRPDSDVAAMYLGNDSSSPANAVIASNYSDLILGRDQSGTLTEHVRIKRDGNVGIGTTSPDGPLHIVKTTSESVIIENSNEGGNSDDLIIKNTFDRDVGLKLETGGGYYHIALDSNGDDSLVFHLADINSPNFEFYQNGDLQLHQYGAGILKTDVNGLVSVDTTTYTTAQTLDEVTDLGNTTTNSISVGAITLANDPDSNNGTFVKVYEDEHKRMYVGTLDFSFTAAGTYNFNLVFPNSGGYQYELTAVNSRNGLYRNFGTLKDSSYIYWESDEDFTHRAEGDVHLISTLNGGMYFSANTTYFLSDSVTDTEQTGSANWSYAIVRYSVYIPYDAGDSTGTWKLHLTTYGDTGSSTPQFVLA